MEVKINAGQKDGKTTQFAVADGKPLQGLKIGETFKGELIDKTGYVFKITGGSNSAGFPMRTDVEGAVKKKILITGGVGFNSKRKGLRRRRTIVGNTVSPKTSQLNVFIEKAGPKPLNEAPAEEAPAEAAE